MNTILQTERLILREFTPEDGALIMTLNADPEILKYVHELPVTDLAAATAKLTGNIIPQYHQYGYGFTALKIPVITAMAHVDNLASLHIIEKCGMQHIGFEEIDNCPVKTFALDRMYFPAKNL